VSGYPYLVFESFLQISRSSIQPSCHWRPSQSLTS
jgi:hypothetical protein